AVSATLELAEGMPFVLEGTLRAMDAQVARVILLDADGRPAELMSRGGLMCGLEIIDDALIMAARDREHPLFIANTRRARSLFGAGIVGSGVHALVASPIWCKGEVFAVMWIGYDAPRHLDQSSVELFSTLTSQASVLIENARLFGNAERERRRLAAILTSTTDAVLVTDRDERILLVNPAGERAFDVCGDAVRGVCIQDAPLPEVLIDVLRTLADVDDRGGSRPIVREVVLADGRTLYANVSTIVASDGQHLGRVAVMRDITRLKELDELKSEFVSAVSHDVRSPLTLIRGYTTMLSEAGGLTEAQETYVERILRGVAQISELVEDLLDLRRIEAGVDLDYQPCHLGVNVSEAVDARRLRAAAKDVTLRLEVHAAAGVEQIRDSGEGLPIMVSGDAPSLRQAFTNLVDNAIKYTPAGGEVVVTLSVAETEDGHPVGARQAVVRVSDTGIGIAPEDQVRLFERFYRVHRSDVPSVSGTGLGLSLVKSIVERHGGTVEVDSQLNQGSVFTVRLPLLEPAASRPHSTRID
ncbi:MAG: ATP-binding protein, partial [Chloroflexota bacterium]